MTNICYIASGALWPADNGNTQRQLNLLLALAEQNNVLLVAPNPKDDFGQQQRKQIEDACQQRVLWVDQASWPPNLISQRLTFDSWRYPRCFVPAEIKALQSAASRIKSDKSFLGLETIDVCFAPIMAAPAAKLIGAENLVIDEQNFEVQRYERLWQAETDPLRKAARLQDQKLVAAYERRWTKAADLVTACSPSDIELTCDAFGLTRDHFQLVPNGVDTKAIKFVPRQPEQSDIVFVGGMSYEPNVLAVELLAKQIMPLVWRQQPATKLWLVGKDPTPAVSALASDRVIVTGTVDSPEPYLAKAALTAVPLTVGGGTRLKLLEAMAAGVPIVASKIAAEGLSLNWGSEALLADTSEQTANEIIRLLNDPAKAADLAAQARRRVEADFSWRGIGRKLSTRLADLT